MLVSGRISHLFLKPGHGQAMLPVEACQAVEGMGLAQDAAFGRSKRQVLLIESETLQAFGIRPGDVRENVTVEGLELSQLAPSTQLSVGEAVLEVVGLCAPCSRMDEVRPGLQEELQDRRGILAHVISGGTMRVGDRISILHAVPADPQGSSSQI
jgi:MOSC domain-containing protein YiiM